MNMLAVPDLDISDAAAYALLKRIADKAAEPMSDKSDPAKTLGECRQEMAALLFEALQFVATRTNRK